MLTDAPTVQAILSALVYMVAGHYSWQAIVVLPNPNSQHARAERGLPRPCLTSA